ncbi:tail fiber assembly protein [Pseudomonas putida]|uniref:tail fiber assembly protein n=1 Tax=Pseudomonas putida TaxID=303 RepID=UPI00186AABF9|nr:tail fiber assembly protein [Pseudomonas putida]
MILKFSPVRSDEQLNVSRLGDMLTVNNVALDFARLAEDATLPVEAIGSSHFAAPVERIGGDLVVCLRLPHGMDAPESVRFPSDIGNPGEGQVSLPGQEVRALEPSAAGVIDWSQVITAEQKAASAIEPMRVAAVAEVAKRRVAADEAITPLQDAVELGRADQAKQDLLKAWKNYRLDLVEVPDQAGYPDIIEWPTPPA